jgi:hypothetical protein
MKQLILSVILSILFVNTYGQTSIVTASNTSRPVPKVGHMLNYLTKPTWTNQSFIDSVKTLNLEIIRYPGGTESQYFDWQTGRSSTRFLPPFPIALFLSADRYKTYFLFKLIDKNIK